MMITINEVAFAAKDAYVATATDDDGGSRQMSGLRPWPAEWEDAVGAWIASGHKLPTKAPTAPPVAPQLSFLQFMDLFTDDEQLAIAGAAMTDAPTKLWYDRAVGAQFIDMGDARLAGGLQALVDADLLTSARRNRVLKALPPE